MKDDPIVEVRLSRNDFGQILDGMIVLADEWRQTAVYHETGAFHEDTVVRECSDADEARNMQQIYETLIDALSAQLHAGPS